jgi:hypothetical protein
VTDNFYAWTAFRELAWLSESKRALSVRENPTGGKGMAAWPRLALTVRPGNWGWEEMPPLSGCEPEETVVLRTSRDPGDPEYVSAAHYGPGLYPAHLLDDHAQPS